MLGFFEPGAIGKTGQDHSRSKEVGGSTEQTFLSMNGHNSLISTQALERMNIYQLQSFYPSTQDLIPSREVPIGLAHMTSLLTGQRRKLLKSPTQPHLKGKEEFFEKVIFGRGDRCWTENNIHPCPCNTYIRLTNIPASSQ